jgi:hypothetical protein
MAIVSEWTGRGYRDTVGEQIAEFSKQSWLQDELPMPTWLGRTDFHESHQSNLLRKDPKWYGQFGWTVPANRSYIWPGEG